MGQIPKESMELCKRVDSMLERATKDPDGFYDYAVENDEIVKNAFLARAVVRGLIDPLPELLTAISGIEEEFSEHASQVEPVDDDEEDEDDEDDEDDDDEEDE
jgi:hypothetical protein